MVTNGTSNINMHCLDIHYLLYPLENHQQAKVASMAKLSSTRKWTPSRWSSCSQPPWNRSRGSRSRGEETRRRSRCEAKRWYIQSNGSMHKQVMNIRFFRRWDCRIFRNPFLISKTGPERTKPRTSFCTWGRLRGPPFIVCWLFLG
jgi:hypothetical protein